MVPCRPVDREVDLREPCGRLVLLVTIERDPLHRVQAGILDEVARLHEHAARAAGRIENDAVIGLDDVDDGLDDRGWREELAIVMRALLRKLREEVFVDAAEHVAGGRAQPLGVEHAHHLFEHAALEACVVLRQLASERREGGFDRLHGGIERRAEVAVLRGLENDVEPRALRQVQRPAPREVGLDQRPVRHLPGGLVGLDRRLRLIEAVRRMTQEDQAHDGHEVFVRRQIGVRP